MPLFGSPPWHMWGTEETLVVTPATGALLPVAAGAQLARINYKRPETWHFFAYAELMGPAVANDSLLITCNIDIIFGVGRSSWQTQGQTPSGSNMSAAQHLIQFQWARPIATSIPELSKKWTSKALSPPLIDGDANSRQVLDSFVAQDIQASARCVAGVAGNNPNVSVRVGIFFAPKVHVRPDWFSGRLKALNELLFRGDETGGT